MYNSFERALYYNECTFKGNNAGQNSMQLMSSQAYIENSFFLDNIGHGSNHGINMITSTAEIYNSTITYSDKSINLFDVQNIDCGFFSMFLGSHLSLGRNTEISKLNALNQAVLCAFSQSTLNITDGVRFFDN